MSDKAVSHFDFTQFRFVAAGILLLAAGLKAWQLGNLSASARCSGQCFHAAS